MKRKGSKVHLAVDTLGQLLAVVVTPANEQERAQVAELAERVQAATGDSVEVAFVDQGYTGKQTVDAAAQHARHSTQYRQETLAGLHFVAFAILMAHRLVTFMTQSA